MPRWLPLVLALLAALPAPAHAWDRGDTLTVIWRPLPNLPAIVRPGDDLTVWANARFDAGGWNAALQLGPSRFPLVRTSGGWDPSLGWWVLGFVIPRSLPEELYDLVVDCDLYPPDTARHAVKVIPAFKGDFYFAQVSDTHLPSHVFSSSSYFSPSDTSGMADFDAVIEDLDLIHPEFILHTGDLVNEGELEEFLDMHEMGRAQAMIYRLRDPLFLVAGNHDIGGWQATPPPAGTSRKEWWRYFGWPALADPPAGYPYHSQDYSFDYGLLHCIGLEGYQNDDGYDGYQPAFYGASSMTQEQMNWLAADLAAVPPDHAKLAFFHYDFRGQFTNLAALGLDGAIWGHYHDVPEGNRATRPFSLGLQSVILNSYGGRTFRIFRVRDGVITPGPMHHSGGGWPEFVDSLSVTWSGANNGTRASLTATVVNLFGEDWNHARLVFHLADRDSQYQASAGTIAQVVRQGGRADVYVDCVMPAGGTLTVAVAPASPLPATALRLDPPTPNPFRPRLGSAVFRIALPAASHAWLGLYDVHGRFVATLFDGEAPAREQWLTWDGRSDAGTPAQPGLYLARLQTAWGERTVKLVVLR
jgi:hypothetical protein